VAVVDCSAQARYSPEVPDVPKLPEGDVPRLPRGRGLRFSGPQLVRIVGTLLLLVFLVVVQRPCANAVSSFVTGFDGRGSAAGAMPRPGTVDVPAGPAGVSAGSAGSAGAAASGSAGLGLDQYEHLRPGMTEADVKAVIERARSKAAHHDAGP
jgi:hypothetical protein